MPWVVKDPDARVDYQFDWGEAYLAAQMIVMAEWSVTPTEPGGISILAESHDLLSCAATLSGGVAGSTYRVTNRVTMSDGQVDERSLIVRVEQR